MQIAFLLRFTPSFNTKIKEYPLQIFMNACKDLRLFAELISFVDSSVLNKDQAPK
jgi:hypothetical protein